MSSQYVHILTRSERWPGFAAGGQFATVTPGNGMADVFISYAKEDHSLASLLAARLEAEGYTVWWDTRLITGDSFRKRIMTELGRARAVIVIWTRHSIESDWVQSEAGRAHAARTLVPVKDPALEYSDIPPPFDNMHTESVHAHDKVTAALTAQLERPESRNVDMGILYKQARYQVLTWLGIAGGALTLFTNIGSFFKLSQWAQWVVSYWMDWLRVVWAWVATVTGISFAPATQLNMTFMIFLLMVAVGSHISYVLITGDRTLPILKHRHFFGWNIPLAVLWYFLFFELINYAPVAEYLYYNFYGGPIDINVLTNFVFVTVFAFLLVYNWPLGSAINTSFAMGIISSIFFSSAFIRDPSLGVNGDNMIREAVPIIGLSIACLLVAAPVLFHKRLWMLLAAFVLLVVGNEVAKFGASF